MHFLAALAASLESNNNVDLQCKEEEGYLDISILPKPFSQLGNATTLPPWTSVLFGVEQNSSSKDRWMMRPTHCRTTFEPIVEGGDLIPAAVSGAVGEELSIMLPKSKMYYNRGWVLDLSEKEKKAKQTLSLYGGLGFLDSKKAFYGIVMSGHLKLLLPYEPPVQDVEDSTPMKLPEAGYKAIDWFHSVVICKVNEKRDDDACEMGRDLGFTIGGVDMKNASKEMNAAGTLYLGQKICVHMAVPPRAVLTTAARIKANDANQSMTSNNNIVFPDNANTKESNDRVGLEVGIWVRNHLLVQVHQGCSVSHAIWEQQIV